MSCKKSPFLKRRVLVPPQVTDLTNVSDNKLMFYQHVMQHSIIFPWGVWEFLLTENTRDFKIQFRKLWQRLLWKSQNFDSLLQLASYERIWSQNQVKKRVIFQIRLNDFPQNHSYLDRPCWVFSQSDTLCDLHKYYINSRQFEDSTHSSRSRKYSSSGAAVVTYEVKLVIFCSFFTELEPLIR